MGPFASCGARGSEGETGPANTTSEARAPLSQRHNSLNEYFLRIDFAETLQSGSLDQNNQLHALIFSKNCSTSGFMAHFRFSIVFEISRYIIDQSALGIAQIEAKDLIKVFDFASWGMG